MIERHDSMNIASLDTGAGANRERVRESVSALFDGEASELELRRLLGSEPAGLVHEAWRDYQLQRDALQGAVDMRFAGIDISARVQAAIAADAAPAAVAAGGARWWRPLASMAVAASVATVVVLGARGFGPTGGFDTGRESNLVAQASPNMSRVHPSLGRVSAGVQPFGPLAAGNGLPGTVFPRNEVVGKSFPAAQTVAFETDQGGPQRAQRYLMRPNERAAVGNQGVINFAKVRLNDE
jgi:sigma-E factor negative regulatory protein RseA